MEINRDATRTWTEVMRTGGLCTDIKNIDDYNNQWELNQNKVDGFLDDLPLNQEFLTSKDILEVHRLSFEGLTDFGGKTSKVQMKFGPHMGAPPGTITKELELCDRQIDILWQKATDDDSKIRVLAFQHIRLVSIHGFLDGNGRTSRRALEFSFERNFGLQRNNVINRDDYIAANNSAISGNIGRLASLFAQDHEMTYSGSDHHIAPYETRAFQVEYDLTGPQGLARSSIQPLESINEANSKNRWLRPSDMKEFISASNGKAGKDFEEIAENYETKIKHPLSVSESIELAKEVKNSGAVKNKFLKKLNIEGFIDVVYKKLQGAVEYASKAEQMTFKEIIRQQLLGKTLPQESDVFLRDLKSREVLTHEASEIFPPHNTEKKSLKAYKDAFKHKNQNTLMKV